MTTIVTNIFNLPVEDEEIHTYSLDGHKLQYFHQETDDPFNMVPILRAMIEWIEENNITPERVDVRYHVFGMDEPTSICGTVEYVSIPRLP